ncbi:hypothetical protein B0H11DRAFT_1965010 [Mycena galericulata]|nr:hypothetical protein B0H11DRAFT_1965010 [Mycena galericulata]
MGYAFIQAEYTSNAHSQTIENTLLCEEVFAAMLSKLELEGEPVVGEETMVTGAFLIFVGSLWDDVEGLNKVFPFVKASFEPLIPAALRAYHEFGRPAKKIKLCAERFSGEVIILQRIWQRQNGMKPPKVEEPCSPLSLAVDDQADGEDDSTSEASASSRSFSLKPVMLTVRANTVGNSFAASTPFWSDQPVGSLLEPFTLKPQSEAPLHSTGRQADAAPPLFRPPRSPLTPKNRPDRMIALQSPCYSSGLVDSQLPEDGRVFSVDSPAGWRCASTARAGPSLLFPGNRYANSRPSASDDRAWPQQNEDAHALTILDPYEPTGFLPQVAPHTHTTSRASNLFYHHSPAGWYRSSDSLSTRQPLTTAQGPSHDHASAFPRAAKRSRSSWSPRNNNDDQARPIAFFSSTGHLNVFPDRSLADWRTSSRLGLRQLSSPSASLAHSLEESLRV